MEQHFSLLLGSLILNFVTSWAFLKFGSILYPDRAAMVIPKLTAPHLVVVRLTDLGCSQTLRAECVRDKGVLEVG